MAYILKANAKEGVTISIFRSPLLRAVVLGSILLLIAVLWQSVTGYSFIWVYGFMLAVLHSYVEYKCHVYIKRYYHAKACCGAHCQEQKRNIGIYVFCNVMLFLGCKYFESRKNEIYKIIKLTHEKIAPGKALKL